MQAATEEGVHLFNQCQGKAGVAIREQRWLRESLFQFHGNTQVVHIDVSADLQYQCTTIAPVSTVKSGFSFVSPSRAASEFFGPFTRLIMQYIPVTFHVHFRGETQFPGLFHC